MEKTLRKIGFRNLSVVDDSLRAELLEAVDRVLKHGRLMLGPEVGEFEAVIAEDCGRKHCVAVSSGTDALFLALKCAGVGPGDEVITTPLSWIATLNAIHLVGATPVFADIGEDLNIDPNQVEAAIGPRTRAVVPVHYNGRLCDMTAVASIANQHQLMVIEDAAQAYGAEVHGHTAGSFGYTSAFSFNPMKVLPGFGEAGAVVTDEDEVHKRLIAYRYLGVDAEGLCQSPWLNAKVDTLHAAMLLVSRRQFLKNVERRLEVAETYNKALSGIVGTPLVETRPGRPSVFYDYQITTDRRDELQRHLAARGIETHVRYATLMPDHPAYAHLKRAPLPVAESIVDRILCLPIDKKLSDDDVARIISEIKKFHAD